MDYSASPLRPWKEIAAEVCRETDTRRVLELSNELDAALEAQTSAYRPASPKVNGSDPSMESPVKETA